MTADVEIRRATAADVPAILSLLGRGMGAGPVPWNAQAWAWKHERSVFGASPTLLAINAGRVVALRAFMRWNWVSDGEAIRAVRAVDTTTHPDYRGRGLFRLLTLQLCEELAGEGVALVFNTPNDSSRPGYLKMGWHQLARVPVWVRPLRPAAAVTRLLGEEPAPVREIAVSDWGNALEVASALLRPTARTSIRIRTERSAGYLAWRYRDAIGPRYHVVVSGCGRAVVVGRVRERNGLQEAMIAEILYAPGPRGALAAVNSIRQFGRDVDAHYMTACAHMTSREAMCLAMAGFVQIPAVGPTFTVRPLRASAFAERALSWRSWRLSLGDLELF